MFSPPRERLPEAAWLEVVEAEPQAVAKVGLAGARAVRRSSSAPDCWLGRMVSSFGEALHFFGLGAASALCKSLIFTSKASGRR